MVVTIIWAWTANVAHRNPRTADHLWRQLGDLSV